MFVQVRRELGKKVLESGGNAVLAYSVQFDTEGASGIVARACGTACKLLKVDDEANAVAVPLSHFESIIPPTASEWRGIADGTGCMALIQRDTAEHLSMRLARELNLTNKSSSGGGGSSTTNRSEALIWAQADENKMVQFQQLIPFGASRTRDTKLQSTRDASGSTGMFPHAGKADFGGLDWGAAGITVDTSNIFQSEVQLLSLRTFPDHVRVKLGGLVMARSVKFLGKLEASVSDQETREGWWTELRDEIKSHAKVLCCKHIIGYTETCADVGDVRSFTADGTAAGLKRLTHPPAYLAYQGGTASNTASQVLTNPDAAAPTAGPSAQKGSPKGSHRGLNHSRSSQDGIAAGRAERSSSVDSVELDGAAGGAPALGLPVTRASSATSATAQEASGNASSGLSTPNSSSQRPLQLDRSTSNRKFSTPAEDAVDPSWLITPSMSRALVPTSVGGVRRTKVRRPCVAAHVPYNHRTAPFGFMRLVPCASCKRKWVPETLLASVDPPASLQVRGCGQMLEARVCRIRKAGSGEGDAVKISEVLPFVEYDLQRQLILKLKVLGMNAAFGYACQVQVGTELVIATATCTAVWLDSLPVPPPVQIVRLRDGRSQQELRLAMLQRQLDDLMTLNKDIVDKQHAHNRAVVRRRQHLAHTSSISRMHSSAARRHSVQSTVGSPPPALETLRESALEDSAAGHGSEERSSLASLEGSMDSYSATGSSSESSSSSSSSSSSDDATSDGDDSSSLESPPSSSSSSSTEKDDDDEDQEDQSDEEMGEEGAAVHAAEDAEVLPPTDDTAVEGGVLTSVKDESAQGVSPRNSRLPSSATASSAPAVDSSGKDKRAAQEKKVHRKRRMVYKDDRAPFLLEVDDETDSDIVAVLSDWAAPIGFDMVNTLVSNGSLHRRTAVVSLSTVALGCAWLRGVPLRRWP
jgi:hypothetical protein